MECTDEQKSILDTLYIEMGSEKFDIFLMGLEIFISDSKKLNKNALFDSFKTDRDTTSLSVLRMASNGRLFNSNNNNANQETSVRDFFIHQISEIPYFKRQKYWHEYIGGQALKWCFRIGATAGGLAMVSTVATNFP